MKSWTFIRLGNVSVAATDNQEYTQAGLKDAISIFKGSVKSQGETNFI